MSLVSDNAGVILTAITGAISSVFLFLKVKRLETQTLTLKSARLMNLWQNKTTPLLLR